MSTRSLRTIYVIYVLFLSSIYSDVYAFQHAPKLYSKVVVTNLVTSSGSSQQQSPPHCSVQHNRAHFYNHQYGFRNLATTHNSHLYLKSSSATSKITSLSSELSSETTMKALAIVALILQNSGLALTMRLSRTKSSSVAYITSTAVLLSEAVKFILSWCIHIHQQRSSEEDLGPYLGVNGGRELGLRDMVEDVEGLASVAIPSALYVFQNNLQYIAMSSLPAAVYQVLVQMKLITAALLSKWYLKKDISVIQWISILVLTIGVIIVQSSIHSGVAGIIVPHTNLALGLTAVGLSCVTSGFAGVRLEKTLKNGKGTLWVRNIQISLVSMLFAAAACLFKDFDAIRTYGFFYGYNPLVWLVICIHAIGGILTSLVVKQTSNIAKGFTTGASIILTSLVSALVLKDVKLNWQFLIGTVVVCVSTSVYSTFQPKRKELQE